MLQDGVFPRGWRTCPKLASKAPILVQGKVTTGKGFYQYFHLSSFHFISSFFRISHDGLLEVGPPERMTAFDHFDSVTHEGGFLIVEYTLNDVSHESLNMLSASVT